MTLNFSVDLNYHNVVRCFWIYEDRWPTSWWMQFSVLLKRGLKERSHESFSGLRIFMVMSVSLLSGLLWWHSRVAHLQDQVKQNKPWY